MNSNSLTVCFSQYGYIRFILLVSIRDQGILPASNIWLIYSNAMDVLLVWLDLAYFWVISIIEGKCDGQVMYPFG